MLKYFYVYTCECQFLQKQEDMIGAEVTSCFEKYNVDSGEQSLARQIPAPNH